MADGKGELSQWYGRFESMEEQTEIPTRGNYSVKANP